MFFEQSQAPDLRRQSGRAWPIVHTMFFSQNEDPWGPPSFRYRLALRGASKLIRGLRHGLTEEERYRVADDVVDRLQQHGDPWRLSEELPDVTGKGYSTPPTKKPNQ